MPVRKAFLIIGIVLLISGFCFFYWASRVNWDYVTTYNDKVNLAYPSYSSEHPQFGAYEYYARYVIMQPNDVLEVSYPEDIQINGTLNIVLVGLNNNTVLAPSGYPFSHGFVYYKNEQPNELVVDVYLIAQKIQNVTVSSTTTLNHYETPQWVCFSVGVVLSSLALIPIFKSKK
jgi:hypothetical protein